MPKLKHFIQCKFTIILHTSVVCVFLFHVYTKRFTDLLSTTKRHYRPLTVPGKGIIGWLKKSFQFSRSNIITEFFAYHIIYAAAETKL